MEFSTTFVHDINSIFTVHDRGSSENHLIEKLSLENNNVFNRFLVTKIEGNEIEIPMIARDYIEHIIYSNISPLSGTLNIHTIILPLYENSIPQEKRTFDSFIRQFFVDTNYYNRLQKIISSTGGVYYGGRGLIFDDKYNPLMMCTLKARKLQIDGVFKIAYFKPIVYINPIVFIEPNKMINKGIIKKIIPCYTNRGIIFPDSRYDLFCNEVSTNENEKAMVIVDNLDRFFAKPTVPKPQSCITESLNECLISNIDDILAMI